MYFAKWNVLVHSIQRNYSSPPHCRVCSAVFWGMLGMISFQWCTSVAPMKVDRALHWPARHFCGILTHNFADYVSIVWNGVYKAATSQDAISWILGSIKDGLPLQNGFESNTQSRKVIFLRKNSWSMLVMSCNTFKKCHIILYLYFHGYLSWIMRIVWNTRTQFITRSSRIFNVGYIYNFWIRITIKIITAVSAFA